MLFDMHRFLPAGGATDGAILASSAAGGSRTAAADNGAPVNVTAGGCETAFALAQLALVCLALLPHDNALAGFEVHHEP
jgi:hypothetical protein